VQILPETTDTAAFFDRLVEDQMPGRRGLEAWVSLLRAHATLMRRLDTDLERETGLALADFDVLAQLANANGELRITELAARALISRSGMTRASPGWPIKGSSAETEQVPTPAESWWRSPKRASPVSPRRRPSCPRDLKAVR